MKPVIQNDLHELFLLNAVDDSWCDILYSSFSVIDKDYLQYILTDTDYLPGRSQFLRAFTMPLSTIDYILFGESPYPRAISANGYAFWDANVKALFSDKGFSSEVNRATSLRNFLKMLLHARGDLHEDVSQQAISQLNKEPYHKTAEDFFNGMMKKGFMLLNASLLLGHFKVIEHARFWNPFMHHLLDKVFRERADISLVLFGAIAKRFSEYSSHIALVAEHPYNLSFIYNADVIKFLKPFDLLVNDER